MSQKWLGRKRATGTTVPTVLLSPVTRLATVVGYSIPSDQQTICFVSSTRSLVVLRSSLSVCFGLRTLTMGLHSHCRGETSTILESDVELDVTICYCKHVNDDGGFEYKVIQA